MNPTAREIERMQLILATLRQTGGRMKVSDLASRIGLTVAQAADAVMRLQMVHGDEDRGYGYVDIDLDGDTVDLAPGLDQGLGRRPLPLTPAEFAALAAAVRAACSGPSAPVGQEASRVLAKVASHVATAPSSPGEPGPDVVALEAPAPDARWADVEAACRAGEELEIEYWSASRDEVTKRPVAPLGLVLRDGNWYLDAICLLRGDPRRFRMDRMASCRRTGRPAPRSRAGAADRSSPPEASPPVATIRFAPRVAAWVRERHAPADVTGRPDGGVDVRIPYDSAVFLAGWVLSFAGAATVVQPASLRAEVHNRLSRSFRRPVN